MIKKKKNFPESGHRGNISQHNKGHTQQNIILNTEKLKAYSLRSETRQGSPPSTLLLNTVLQVLDMAIREERKEEKESKSEKKK